MQCIFKALLPRDGRYYGSRYSCCRYMAGKDIRNENRIIESVKDEVKRIPVQVLFRSLYPSMTVKDRGITHSPFREDKTPSFSCFVGKNGYGLWKDFSTGESGDIVSFYQKAFPGTSYPKAVNEIALLLLHKPALENFSSDGREAVRPVSASAFVSRSSSPAQESALKVISATPVAGSDIPVSFRDYWRGRGISDAVAARFLSYVIYENENIKGRPLYDRRSGLQVVDSSGNAVVSDGRREALGFLNGLGGYSLRSPKGVKISTSSFISVIPSGSEILRTTDISYLGGPDPRALFRYDVADGSLLVGDSGRIVGAPGFDVVRPVLSYLFRRPDSILSSRELQGLCYVLSSLRSLPPQPGSVQVVEGMFDALSLCEYDRMKGRDAFPTHDIVVLNSLSNLRWAVPYLASHRRIVCLLDNDLRSNAGRKAADAISGQLDVYCKYAGIPRPEFVIGTSVLGRLNDVNEALMAGKGFRVKSTNEVKPF